ncbi:MAG TPA: site-specific DNA-methyltransferase [Fibrobacteria bacterium]|nr:site-specific DNA-methyltransferase [Fibrobacteria bacterium]HOX52518.1 site-specific DNA-methyltransferase [Fibrobacteria bacterium]
MNQASTGMDDPRRPPEGLLLQGDNLDVLPRLLDRYRGRCRLVLADPPYNARNRKDYHDDLDSDRWLAGLEARIPLFCRFLSDDGILAFHIDDSEQAHLQTLLDRLLGRELRLNTVCVKMSELSGVKMRYQDRLLPRVKEYILLYGASPRARLNPLRRGKSPERLESYLDYYRGWLENPDAPVETWKVSPLRSEMKHRNLSLDAESVRTFQLEHAERIVYRTNNRWFSSLPPQERPSTTFAKLVSPWGETYVWWEGKQMLFLADHLEEPVSDLWTDFSTINLGREGGIPFPSGKKPELLALRLLDLCTRPGDLVLDPFCGSGTTAAVAHKSGRDWITVETDPAIFERARRRLESVVSGKDSTGATEALGWKGGGGFRWGSHPEGPFASFQAP